MRGPPSQHHALRLGPDNPPRGLANIFVKNGANMAGLDFGGEGYCAMSIAGTSGEGLTKASTFTRPRRCTLVDYFRIV